MILSKSPPLLLPHPGLFSFPIPLSHLSPASPLPFLRLCSNEVLSKLIKSFKLADLSINVLVTFNYYRPLIFVR